MSSAAQALANAIAQNESEDGLGFPGTNNPGNLELGDQGFGTLTAAGGNQITVFPSLAEGQQALINQANAMISGSSTVYNPDETIAQAASTYTGGNVNAASNWANSLGVSPNSTLGSLANLSQSIQSGTLGAVKGAISAASFFSDPERLLTAIVGLILVAAGVFAFKQTQTIIATTGKVAKKGAELLA